MLSRWRRISRRLRISRRGRSIWSRRRSCGGCRRAKKDLERAGAPLKVAPVEGPSFFERHGWNLVDVQSLLHTAARLKRLPFGMRLVALLPDSKGRVPRNPWAGVCLFARQS